MWRYRRIMARVVADPASRTHFDEALRPHTAAGETDHFVEMYADKIPHTHGAPARAPAAVCETIAFPGVRAARRGALQTRDT